jgi:hypothetical protein
MQAIEFNSRVEDGHIAVPETVHLVEGQSVRVLILLDETAAIKDAVESDAKSVWARTSGAWQGAPLVRESEGQCEIAQMQAPVSRLKDSDLQKAPQALMRAAEKARQLAEETGTPFVVRNSGKPTTAVKQK